LDFQGGYQTKQSLVYDLQEPFRWIADVVVVEAFESGVLDLPNFYFIGDDYRYRFEPEAKQRFLDLLRDRFNPGVRYKRRLLKWDTIIERKAMELGRFLIDRSTRLDFAEPVSTLHTLDDRQLRNRILSLSQQEAGDLGIGRSTLHYLRRGAMNGRTLKLHAKTLSKFDVARL
jgi:CRISPR-associated protein Cas1